MLEVDVVRISVIVPIYNVKLYIERCVRSLMEQTLENIEFIFVNDCTQMIVWIFYIMYWRSIQNVANRLK